MSKIQQGLIAAGIVLTHGAAAALGTPPPAFDPAPLPITLTYDIATLTHWGNLEGPLGAGASRTFAYTFQWQGAPGVGSVFVGGSVRGPSDTAVTFANMALWRCTLPGCASKQSIVLQGVRDRDKAFNGDPTDVFNRYFIDRIDLDSGLYLFSFDVTNNTEKTLTVNGSAGVFPDLAKRQPPVTPVPEPGTWALMLAGLGVVAWAARGRRRDRSPAVA